MVESYSQAETAVTRPLVSRVFRKVCEVSTLVAREFRDSYFLGAQMYFEDAVDAPRHAKEKMFDVHMRVLSIQDKVHDVHEKILDMEGKIQASTLIGSRVLTTPADPLVLYRMYERASINLPGMLLDQTLPLHDRGVIAYWLFMKLCSWTGNPMLHVIPGTKSNEFIRSVGKQLYRTVADPRNELPVTVYKSVVLGEDVTNKAVDIGVQTVKKAVGFARRCCSEPVDVLCNVMDSGITVLDSGYRAARFAAHTVNRVVDAVPPLSFVKENMISAGELLLDPVIKIDELLTRYEQPQLPQEFVAIEYRGAARRRLWD